jgi:hypothetical protein
MRKDRGFAALPLADRRRLAALGGARAHANGTAHRWTVDEARDAGRKGGLARAAQAAQARRAGYDQAVAAGHPSVALAGLLHGRGPR